MSNPLMADHTELSDADLVDQACAGDLEAFDVLVERYQQSIAGLLFRFCPNKADLEDLVQETMVKAYRKLETKRTEAPFDAWLKKIAVNIGRDHYRKSRREPTHLAAWGARADEDPDKTLEQHACEEPETGKGYTEEVQKVLSLLEPEDRTLMTLHYLHDTPVAEIAEQMDWSVTKTKVRMFRARKKLQSIAKNYGISR